MSTSDGEPLKDTDVHRYLDKYGPVRGSYRFYVDHSPISPASTLILLAICVAAMSMLRAVLGSMGVPSPWNAVIAVGLLAVALRVATAQRSWYPRT